MDNSSGMMGQHEDHLKITLHVFSGGPREFGHRLLLRSFGFIGLSVCDVRSRGRKAVVPGRRERRRRRRKKPSVTTADARLDRRRAEAQPGEASSTTFSLRSASDDFAIDLCISILVDSEWQGELFSQLLCVALLEAAASFLIRQPHISSEERATAPCTITSSITRIRAFLFSPSRTRACNLIKAPTILLHAITEPHFQQPTTTTPPSLSPPSPPHQIHHPSAIHLYLHGVCFSPTPDYIQLVSATLATVRVARRACTLQDRAARGAWRDGED